MRTLIFLPSLVLILILAAGCAPAVESSAALPEMSNKPVVNDSAQVMDTGSVIEGQLSIAIKGFAFTPKTVTIKVGTQVTWTNNDSAAHTATSVDRSFDSGILNQGESLHFPIQYNRYVCVHLYSPSIHESDDYCS